MDPSLRIPVLPLLVLLAAGALPAPAHATCPVNEVVVASWDGVVEPSTLPAYAAGGNTSWAYGQDCGGACYDLRQGYVVVRGLGGGSVTWPTSSNAKVSDAYTIEGLPPGTPCTVTVLMQLGVAIDDSAYVGAEVSELAGGASQSFGGLAYAPGSPHVLSLALQETAGVPFVLQFIVSASGMDKSNGASMVDARIRFGDLPKEAWVTSCQQYELPVPVRATSWGTVKATYR